MQSNRASSRTRNRIRLSQFFGLLVFIVTACNLPAPQAGPTAQVVSSSAPPVVEEPLDAGNAPGQGFTPTPLPAGNGADGGGYSGSGPTPAPWTRPTLIVPFTEPPPLAGTGNLPPPDIAVTIDCSALPARQAECDAYARRTREMAYPNLRDLAGVSLANCFTPLRYIIVPGDVAESGHVGVSNYDQITFGETPSLDWGPGNTPYDVHEMVHSFDACSGAFSGSGHLLMGMLLNAVYARLGIYEMPYARQQPDVIEDYQNLVAQSPTTSNLSGVCEAIIADRANLAHFAYGDAAARRIYRSAIARTPQKQPNAVLSGIFGANTTSYLAVIEALEKEFGEPMNVPACGF